MNGLKWICKSFITAYLVGGFIFFIFTCPGCDGGLNSTVGGRLLGALFMGILSVFSFGFPPQNEAGVGDPFNTWPGIIGFWLFLCLYKYYQLIIKPLRTKNSKP